MNRHKSSDDSSGFGEAFRAFKAESYEAAADIVRQILRHHPEDSQANHLMGLIASRNGQWDIAARFLVKSINADPARFMVHCDLGEALSLLGRLDESRIAYQRSLALEPHNPRAKKGLWVVRRKLGEAKEYYSQAGQDEFIHQRFFGDKRNGLFLDIGAYDGVTGSNTYFFERHLGWSGFCFEPSPGQFLKLVQNREALCVNACLSDYEGESQFMDITEGLTMMGGLVENYDPQHLNILRQRKGQKIEMLTTPVIRLSSFLEEEGIRKIDYCSIDVEGSEMKILRDLDYERTTIEVFSVENNSDSPEIRDFMNTIGYRFVDRIGVDEIYHRSPEQA